MIRTMKDTCLHFCRWTVGLAICVCLLSACSDDWNNHYGKDESLPTASLMQQIAAEEDLSLFMRMLELTGLDSVLSSSQTYTVWAPVDAALEGLDMSDVDAIARVLKNHVARYASPSSTDASQKIYMLNGKPMHFAEGRFSGVELLKSDVRCKNGILHKIADQIPYKYSILEYISLHPDYSHLYDFICRFDEKIYDAELSSTYDSVFVKYNPLLQDPKYGMGDIANEDSLYTMILPDNAAWQAAYDRISPYFRPFNKEVALADSIQKVQTSLAIVEGLSFRQAIVAPAKDDSLLTVTQKLIYGAGDYLNGYEALEASNGMMYLAKGQLNANDTCVWNHVINLEAENMDYRQSLSGTNAYIRTTDINSLVQNVSDASYLEVSSGNVDGGIVFDIPNTLAATYDVYVDFVSPLVDGENMSEEKTKLVFQLKFMGDNGRQTIKNNNTATEVAVPEKGGIVSVKAFSAVPFPVADFYDNMWKLDKDNIGVDIAETTTLQVKTKVSSTDAKKGYVRKFRIDRIRLVPSVK